MKRMALSGSKKSIGIIRWKEIKNKGDFYCLNCIHSFRKKYKLESHKKVCENKNFCDVVMPFENIKKFEFNQSQKYDQSIIYCLCSS